MSNSQNPQFSAEQFKKILASTEGRQLIALFQRDGGTQLQEAAEQFRQGNVKAAQELLRPITQKQEVSELLDKINGK